MYSTLIGFFIKSRTVNNGLILSIKEKPLNKLQVPVFYNIAIWGQPAQAIQSRLEKGLLFQFRVWVKPVVKKGKTYLNYTVETWKVIPQQRPKRNPSKVQDDDWFVPGIQQRSNRASRRYEGFSG